MMMSEVRIIIVGDYYKCSDGKVIHLDITAHDLVGLNTVQQAYAFLQTIVNVQKDFFWLKFDWPAHLSSNKTSANPY